MSDAELLLPEGFAPEQLASALAGSGLVAEDAGAEHARRVYYDTFDGRLRAAGTPAVYEHGRLVLNGVSEPVPGAPERVLVDELQPGPLRDALVPLIDVRALLPLAAVEVSEQRLRILDDQRKTVVRASIERPELIGAAQTLRSRLRLVPLRGYDSELGRISATLEQQLGLEPPPMSLVDEAVAALGGTPGGLSAKIDVALAYEQRADTAAIAVLRRLLEVIDANVEGAITDLDSEFLHDLRVSVRRTRSVQRQLKAVFPPSELQRFRVEFRWVQTITGEVRDLDVYLLGFERMAAMVPSELRADLEPLREVLRRHRAQARAKMVGELRSERFSALRAGWAALLEGLPTLPEYDRPAAATPIGVLAGQRTAKVYRRMVKEGGAIDPDGPSEPFHELRKRGKELRYLLELFGTALYPTDVVKPMIKALKGLQDVLGRHQDREVQVAVLRSLGGDVALVAPGPEPLLAMGALIASLEEDKWSARHDFAGRFETFASPEQRELVRDTFV